MPLVYFTEEDWELAHETLQVDSCSIVYDKVDRTRLAQMLGRILVIEPYEVTEETLEEDPPR